MWPDTLSKNLARSFCTLWNKTVSYLSSCLCRLFCVVCSLTWCVKCTSIRSWWWAWHNRSWLTIPHWAIHVHLLLAVCCHSLLNAWKKMKMYMDAGIWYSTSQGDIWKHCSLEHDLSNQHVEINMDKSHSLIVMWAKSEAHTINTINILMPGAFINDPNYRRGDGAFLIWVVILLTP